MDGARQCMKGLIEVEWLCWMLMDAENVMLCESYEWGEWRIHGSIMRLFLIVDVILNLCCSVLIILIKYYLSSFSSISRLHWKKSFVFVRLSLNKVIKSNKKSLCWQHMESTQSLFMWWFIDLVAQDCILKNIIVLFILDNVITKLHPMQFKNLTKLRMLRLENNQVCSKIWCYLIIQSIILHKRQKKVDTM